MEQQRERARKAQKKEEISVEQGELRSRRRRNFLVTTFLRPKRLSKRFSPAKTADELNVVLDRTPFMPRWADRSAIAGCCTFRDMIGLKLASCSVIDTQKRGDVFVHRAHCRAKAVRQNPAKLCAFPSMLIDAESIQGHHTVTHLLHWALHEVVSRDATQKGSYVGPDKLTFDFSSAALTPQQKRDVEKLVNEKIAENAPVSWTEIPYAEAKKRSDIQQFFGDKYGDVVRVVQIGGDAKKLNGYSMELCGGTHVRTTGEIESFRIVREEAIAAGIRRIEAVSGDAARQWAKEEAERQQKKFEMLARKKSDVAALPVFEERRGDPRDARQDRHARGASRKARG